MLIPNTDAGCKKILPINKRYQEETLKVPIVKNPTPPLIISIKHVKQIENCSRSTASRRIKMVWDSLGKNQQQRITVEEYTTYYGYSITDILNRIS